MAADPALVSAFRTPNFRGGFRGSKGGLMTENEANQDKSAEEAIQQCEQSGSLELDLNFCRLTAVPEYVLTLDHITELHLHQNALESLPECMGNLSALQKLVLKENRLTSLPASLCMCEDLSYLDASNNQLTALPEEFVDLLNIQTLALDYNYFDSLPKCVTVAMTNLEYCFFVENSGLHSLPAADQWSGPRKKLVLAIDNSPELSNNWDVLKPALSAKGVEIEMKWNKIWPDSVQDGVYLGSLRSVQDSRVFEQLKISHVLTCGRNLSCRMNVPSTVNHLVLEVDDSQKEPIEKHFSTAITFIDGAVKAKGNCVVHCFAGVSRSSTVVVAYLMAKEKMSFDQAMRFVKTQRPAANPNPNFIAKLKEYEHTLSAQ